MLNSKSYLCALPGYLMDLTPEEPPFIPGRRSPPVAVSRAMTQQVQDFLHDAVNTDDPEFTRACCNLAAMEAEGIMEVIAWLETCRPAVALRQERIIP